MAPHVHVVHLEAHIVEEGVWRDCCMLPSGCRIVLTLRNNPSTVIARGVWCRDCGDRSPT